MKTRTAILLAALSTAGCSSAAETPAATGPYSESVDALFENAPGYGRTTSGRVFLIADDGTASYVDDAAQFADLASFDAGGVFNGHSTLILCAVRADHTVACKGSGASGGLPFAPSGTCTEPGSGGKGPYDYPCETSFRVVPDLAAKAVAGSCFLGVDGDVRCAPISGSAGATNAAPTKVALPAHATALAAYPNEVCATLETGALWCWGSDAWLSKGCAGASCNALREVSGVSGARGVALHLLNGCAVQADGHAACWGSGHYGANGDGSLTDRLAPARVAGDLSFVQISTNMSRTCAVTTDGKLACWGQAFAEDPARPGVEAVASGQLARKAPAVVPGLANVAQVVIRTAQVLVRHTDGSLDEVQDAAGLPKVVRLAPVK
jgi:hypothetical protein